jgi:four helix bundle protein
MRDIRKYEVFQLADRLVIDVCRLTSGFPKTETYGLTDQMRRAAASIPMNLTEGSARSGPESSPRWMPGMKA